MQESVGRVATILFAHRVGTALEPECKTFRFAADLLNDTAMVLDCLSPALPKAPRVLLLSLASALRALCGVAAGSSKASLSAHFAKQGNLAELNAVCGRMRIRPFTGEATGNMGIGLTVSTERFKSRDCHITHGHARTSHSALKSVAQLTHIKAGSFVISRVTSPIAVWASLLLLIAIHLYTNYMAVRSVILPTLNRQRATLALSALLTTGKPPTPFDVARHERIFPRSSALSSPPSRFLGHCHVGVSLSTLLRHLPGATGSGSRTYPPSSSSPTAVSPRALLATFARTPYVLWFDSRRRTAHIAFKAGCEPRDQLRAWCHALLVAGAHADGAADADGLTLLRRTGDELARSFEGYEAALREVGWDLATGQLETRPRVRLAGGG